MLAGECIASCTVPVRNESGTIVARPSLNQCTHNGTDGGNPVPPRVANNGSYCKTDSDCASSDGWCELGASVTKVGMCVCIFMHVHVGMCACADSDVSGCVALCCC